jgi:predicted naringenin-chalcone synthase
VKDGKAQFKGYTLYDEQIDVLRQVAKDYGLSSAAALRYIISDWARQRAEKDGVKGAFVPGEAEAVA